MSLGRMFGVAMTLVLGACSAPGPYVYKANEFNRNLPTFAKEPAEISQVTVCYGSAGAAPADVVALAVQECARYGKQARFLKQDRFICPVLTPISAHYACDGPPRQSLPGAPPAPAVR